MNFQCLWLLVSSSQWLAASFRVSSKITRLVMSANGASSIRVFDNVMSEESCLQLDERLTAQLDTYGSRHHLYYRNETPNCLLEFSLDSILKQLGDPSPIVEYWFRDEWLNLELHRDCDELLLQENGTLRYPENGHIYYLYSGSQVCGPTLIFNDESSLPPLQTKLTDVTIVPAKSNRLVTFNGTLAHAVVRPPFAYYDESEGGSNLELFIRKGRPTTLGDKRSVVLFNTWTEPPLAIGRGSVKENDMTNIINEKSEWVTQSIAVQETVPTTKYINFMVPLLGTKHRRGGVETSLRFLIDSSSREKIVDKESVSRFTLKPVTKD